MSKAREKRLSTKRAKLFLSVRVVYETSMRRQEITPMCKNGFYLGLEYIYVFTLAVSGKNFLSTLELCKDARVAFTFAVLSCQQAEAM